MTNLLTLNAGSATVKLAAFRATGFDVQSVGTDTISCNSSQQSPVEIACAVSHAIRKLERASGIDDWAAIVHRVVHGGSVQCQPALTGPHVRAAIEAASRLAPLHNPVVLATMSALERSHRQVPQIAVFDTGFFADMPPVAQQLPLPEAITSQLSLRRHGFHGLAHSSMWRQLREALPAEARLRVITLQLGSGASVAALRDGVAQDISMGYSPLEGLVMGTRCGDLDAGVLLTLLDAGYDAGSLRDLLGRRSGLLGVSGRSAELRELLATDDARCRLAVELYCYRIRQYMGSMMAVLGGLDVVAFGGGVGENSAQIRSQLVSDMAWAGLRLDPNANRSDVSGLRRISTEGVAPQVWVTPVDESRELARAALPLLAKPGEMQ